MINSARLPSSFEFWLLGFILRLGIGIWDFIRAQYDMENLTANVDSIVGWEQKISNILIDNNPPEML
ncbi:MAG: hypothetical protein SVY53_14520 [Chloroflexota bacterium]|nr:hypothetical protein [Chloroflexota bacterium]